MVADSPLINIY